MFHCRYFPKIFGPNEDQELDKTATMRQFEKVTAEVNAYLKDLDGPTHKPMDVSEVAMGFIRVANEAMCRPIRALTQVRGRAVCCLRPNIGPVVNGEEWGEGSEEMGRKAEVDVTEEDYEG